MNAIKRRAMNMLVIKVEWCKSRKTANTNQTTPPSSSYFISIGSAWQKAAGAIRFSLFIKAFS